MWQQSYVVAETTMPGRSGFDFMGSGQAFNTLAAYLFGKVWSSFGGLNNHLVLLSRQQAVAVVSAMTLVPFLLWLLKLKSRTSKMSR